MPDKEELKQVEEYRVVGDGREGPAQSLGLLSLQQARSRAEELAAGSGLVRPWKNVRIQSRTVAISPWKDVPSE